MGTSRLTRRYVDCAFGQLHLTRHADRDPTAKPLLMINSRARSSIKLMEYFPQSVAPFVIDVPGFGLSSALPAGSSMFDAADAMAAALEAEGIGQADVHGLHTGHKISAALAARYPDRIRRLIVAGKTHSIVADQEARNRAMKAQVAARAPDVALLGVEGVYADDTSQRSGSDAMYAANFGFDFAQSMRDLKSPTLVMEITSEDEDARYPRSAPGLAALNPLIETLEIDQREPTGLDLYIGTRRMAEESCRFFGYPAD